MPFGADLGRRLGAPVSIDSDVNLAALAEHWFGQARDLNDFLVVNVERSLGLAILHNGELFRGANGLSPDFGDFMLRAPSDGGGRLADAASETSVIGEAEALLRSRDRDAPTQPDRILAALIRRAAAGDAGCARVLARAGEALGFAIANLITLFAPPKVIISGRAMAMSEHFIAPLRATVAALLPPSLADVSDIVVREWGERHLGARRSGHDAARSLWRALGYDRASAHTRSGRSAGGRISMTTGARRRDRLRQHQRRLPEGRETLSGSRYRGALRHEIREAAAAQVGRVRNSRPTGRSGAQPIPRSRWS